MDLVFKTLLRQVIIRRLGPERVKGGGSLERGRGSFRYSRFNELVQCGSGGVHWTLTITGCGALHLLGLDGHVVAGSVSFPCNTNTF